MRRKEEERHSEVGHKKFGEGSSSKRTRLISASSRRKEEDQKGAQSVSKICGADDDPSVNSDRFCLLKLEPSSSCHLPNTSSNFEGFSKSQKKMRKIMFAVESM